MAMLQNIQDKKDLSIKEILDIIKQYTDSVPEETVAKVVKAIERVMDTGGLEKRDGRERGES